ncbi:hypothetical protein [Antarcticimicrobium luteum]|uniref:Transporter n=1 Tax=Antarcticimicrobium luteum TaxID=2547397 RepID=A0A4R5USR4_9RHOB|nr:hypothetical protein [Antarcticimicrobium luteum]TDK42152.1 hypothetical protein E1832_18585 [Antarcticimicrobium luteum]
MRRLVPLLIALSCAAPPAGAGAWQRETGRGFVSTTGTLRQGDPDARQELSVYADYGLAPRLTIGADVNERPGIAGHAVLFARLPLSRPGARARLAAEAAFGGHHWRGAWDPMYRLTLSYGRGSTTRSGATGWLALDAAYERRLGMNVPIYKLDATLGLSAPGRLRPILQVETAHIPGQPLIWAVTPGVLIDSRRNATWLIGLERKSAGRDTVGLKIALWRWF